ncbi:hypothetical protein [Halopenitus persicus]|uniref:hypothetical protein n=1 Tax=Halopenitus persicus TaxID=1048396 RepID=UPI000BBAABDA|nr:hypothetical protein [Halopenitus persicus]
MSLFIPDDVGIDVVTKHNRFAQVATEADSREEMLEMLPHFPDELAELIHSRTTLNEDESKAVALRIRRHALPVDEAGLVEELDSAREKIRNSRSTLYGEFDEADLGRIEDLAWMAQHLAGKGI